MSFSQNKRKSQSPKKKGESKVLKNSDTIDELNEERVEDSELSTRNFELDKQNLQRKLK